MAPNDNPQPLSPERLAEIRARVEAVSPDLWRFVEDRGEIYSPNGHLIADVWEPTHDSQNAEFLAHAPEDMRALLAAVEQLTARVAELERPEVERRRAEIVLSHQQLAAQARADRDYEGEAEALRLLRNRQADWAAEDTKAGWTR